VGPLRKKTFEAAPSRATLRFWLGCHKPLLRKSDEDRTDELFSKRGPGMVHLLMVELCKDHKGKLRGRKNPHPRRGLRKFISLGDR